MTLGLLLALVPRAHAREHEEPLEALVDRVVETQLARDRIPGATVAVVRDGRVLHVKGYGSADEERHVWASRGCLALGLTPVALAWSVRAEWKQPIGGPARVSIATTVLGVIALSLWGHHWHLLG